MPRLNFLPILFAALLILPAVEVRAQDGLDLDTPEKRASYAIGQNVGNGVKNDLAGIDLDIDVLVQAIRDAYGEKGGQMSQEDMTAAFNEMQNMLAAIQAKAAEARLAENKAFLDEQGTKDGVQATENGILYRIDKEGDGERPLLTETVVVHYTGRLTDGTIFDSSVERGQPATFPVGGVIPGWTQILQEMPVGSTWEVWIPSELGYGAQGAGEDIPPNSVLNFTIELLEIKAE
jgi:FKBP-type peptidyl-prolyl cis-trans isomerase